MHTCYFKLKLQNPPEVRWKPPVLLEVELRTCTTCFSLELQEF